MLFQFSVSNFLSIKEEQTFSMIAANLTGHEEDNLFSFQDFRVLRSAVIYGPNASGKSNFIAAIEVMRNLVHNSVQNSTQKELFPAWHFSLDERMQTKPTIFEVIFAAENTMYRYGFELLNDRVSKEYLYFVPNSREALLFERTNDVYKFGKYSSDEFKGIKDKTNTRALFLTVAAQFNSKQAAIVLNWFQNFNAISGLASDGYREFTASKILKDPEFKMRVSEMMQKADMGICSIDAKHVEADNLPTSLPKELRHLLMNELEVFTTHKATANDGTSILKQFNMETDESEGTKKYFALAGPILDTLESGGVLVVDELDSKLHPLLTRHIVQLFNSVDSNPNNAQLVFATHDTTLLSLRFFRRDQIWFVNKLEDGSSTLYALSDYKDEDGRGVRKDSTIQTDYFQGKFDAIPFIQ
ncbi:ATP-binding protein [Sporosarcina jeotgali]|uniref:ATP-binding protein n=1 Tax=Sporosarcina jeotgali TaxID=3020056 RepID=A0ABZ0KU55_9BACL|nr:ATP-binding protein [Sporosarcina sp. B2O-1]WOV83671.1 ATP-binding protein [Sporosarcina sp. B2O-1]